MIEFVASLLPDVHSLTEGDLEIELLFRLRRTPKDTGPLDYIDRIDIKILKKNSDAKRVLELNSLRDE